MPKMSLILNPTSNRGNTLKRKVDLQAEVERQAALAAEAFEITWHITEYPGHATELAQQAVNSGADIVVAVGGDGTAHEVVNGLLQFKREERPLLGIIPSGSGNDYAFNFGLPADPAVAIAHLFEGKTRTIDAGMISDPSGHSEHWDNTLGFGFSGAVNEFASSNKLLRGFILYLVAVIQCIVFHPQDLEIMLTLDDGQVLERRIAMLSINNGPREGGGFPTMPQAVMDDGKLSYMIMRYMSRLRMFYFIPVVMMSKQSAYPRFFEPGLAKTIHVKSDKPMYIHADGEQYAFPDNNITEVEVKILPASLDVLCNGCS